MDLLAAVLAGFLVAPFAPFVTRFARGAAGWCLALVPLLLGLYFTRQFPAVSASEALTAHVEWAPQLGVSLAFRLDALALLFTQLICYVGALVFVYAGSYLADSPQRGRFFLLLLLFMAAMLGLVLADNILVLFVFWELTSITSYLLIGFDHERERARAAALQALLVTGGGGLALLAGLVLLAQAGGSYEFSQLAARAAEIQQHALYLPALALILLGAFTKSAQFPFHFWLPGAMEAPTPVSAYLHSATMVKAGIYLLARFTPVLAGTPAWFWSVTSVGAVTLLVGAWLALHPTDLKRILAYLTVSALGLLTLLLGLGGRHAIEAVLAYLVAHALYKGALFLVAGTVDHATGTRDIQRLSGLGRIMPLVAAAALLAAASMAGLPPLNGFVAKEAVYEAAVAEAPAVLTGLLVAANMAFFAVAMVVGVRPWFGTRRATPHEPHGVAIGLWMGALLLSVASVLWGLRPQWGLEPLLSAAAANVLGEPVAVHLPLWHGWTTAVTLSLITMAGGVLVYALLGAVRTLGTWTQWFAARGPAQWYEWTLAGMMAFAKWQTARLQSGYLRHYFLIVLATGVGLPAFVLLTRHAIAWPRAWDEVLFYEAALFTLVLVAALMATLLKARLAAIAALGVVGYGVALIFILFGAPDVAMTQFVVETLTVILFVLVFHHLPDSATVSRSWVRARDALLAIAVGGLMTVLAWTMAEVQFHDSISQYYLDNSLSAAHGRNIVNVILVDFRGLDTLGEITVLAVAGVGVYALLKLQIHGKPEAHPPVPIAKQRSDAGAWAPVATSPDAGDALPPRAAGEPR